MKKWSKLVLATMVSMGTLMISGCIENLEPAGIADLRGAKAELLRAQTALQAAQAAKVEADAALVLAQAKVQEAIAKQEEARVKYFEAEALAEQYRAELLNIQNEEARTMLEALIADQEAAMVAAEQEAALAAEQFKIDMLNALTQLADAQLQYDQALIDIELARNTLTVEQSDYLSSRLSTFLSLKADVTDATRELEDAAADLADALAAVDDAELRNTSVRSKQREIVKLQAALEAAQEAQEKVKGLMDLDPNIADWDAERVKIEKEIDALEKEMALFEKEMSDKAADVQAEMERLEDKIDFYVATTGYELDMDMSDPNDPETWGTGLFKKIQSPYLITEFIPVPDVQIRNEELGDFEVLNQVYEYGKEDDIVALFDQEIMEYTYEEKYYIHYDKYWNEMTEAEISKKEADEEYLKAVERYSDAVAAAKSGDYLAYFAKHVYTVENGYAEDYDFVEEVATYNAALKAFADAVDDYKAEEVRLTVDQVRKEEIQNAYDNELAVLDAERAKGFQDAEAKYAAALAKYQKAYYVNQAAIEKRDRIIEAAEKTADATESQMEYFESTYVEAAATDEEKAKHALYVKALENIKNAREAYQNPDPEVKTDPESVWAAAIEQWIKDEQLYDYNHGAYDAKSVYADIQKSYADKKFDLDNKYDIIWNDFYANYPNFSTQYRNEWISRLNDLRADLQDAVYALIPSVNNVLRESGSSDDVDYSVNLYAYDGSDDGTLMLKIFNAPSYLINGEGVLEEVVATDLVDKDYFIWENAATESPGELMRAANDLWYSAEITVHFKDGSINNCSIYADESSEWPYALPDYDTFVDVFNNLNTAEISYIEFMSGQGYLADIYMEKLSLDIETTSEDAYYAAIPDHIKAVEAAKAQFVEYAKAKNAEIDALRTEIEKVVPTILEEYKTAFAEAMALYEKNDVLTSKLANLEDIISVYCLKADPAGMAATLEELVAALEAAYETEVDNVLAAENAIIEAEEELQAILDGLVDALTLAQRDYDDAQAILEFYQEMFDMASEELETAIGLIYGDEELPEDPGTGNGGGTTPAA